jgi:cysteine desulfurase
MIANFRLRLFNHPPLQEHKCVLDSCRHLADQGFEITYLPVLPNGKISLEALKDAIKPNTALISIMAVNNEIGVIQPLAEIGQLLKDLQKQNGGQKVLFHTDAAQAVGKIEIDVEKMGIDAMSISGHKLYGPKGVGAAYVRRRPRVRLEPLIHGGGQERGLRSGTVPTALVVGLGESCKIASREMQVSVLFGRCSESICLWGRIELDDNGKMI